jgi:hypothetical protein
LFHAPSIQKSRLISKEAAVVLLGLMALSSAKGSGGVW